MRPAKLEVPEPGPPDRPAAPAALASLDLDIFRTPIWVAEAPPPAPPPAPAAPPPIKVQLLAIVQNDGVLKAILYDPDTDRLITAGEGDEVLGKKIERIDRSTIGLRDGPALRTLSLRDAGRSGS